MITNIMILMLELFSMCLILVVFGMPIEWFISHKQIRMERRIHQLLCKPDWK